MGSSQPSNVLHDTASPKQSGYWAKLSSFYFFYFALLGAFAPFWGLYLQDKKFSALEISQIMSILMWTKVFAPNIWGWLIDKTKKRLPLVRLASFLATLSFIGIFFLDNGSLNQFWTCFFVITCFSFFWNAILPQIEVITLFNLGDKRTEYGKIRLWGSIGFIVVVTILGYLFDFISISYLPIVILLSLIAIWLTTLSSIPEPKVSSFVSDQRFLKKALQPRILIFIFINLLLQISHGAYYTWFSILLKGAGYSTMSIGLLWSLGVIAEVILFMFMHTLFERFKLKSILLIALLLTTLRWVIVAFFYEYPLVMVFNQLLHAASFGAMHAASIYFIHQTFKGRHEGQGQALYSSIGFGLGGALGAIISGLVVVQFNVEVSFLISSVISALAALMVLFYFKYPQDTL